MAQAECYICNESLPINRFRVPKCGHASCSTCLSRWIDLGNKNCPECRRPMKKEDLRPLFIALLNSGGPSSQTSLGHEEDKIVKHARNVSENLARMDRNASTKTVNRAVRELEKVAVATRPGVERNHPAESLIWLAVNDFKERIAPLFAEVGEQRQQIGTLKASETALNFEKQQMKSKIKQSSDNLEQALQAAESATSRLRAMKDENARLIEQVASCRQETDRALGQSKEVADENVLWQTRMTAHKDKELKQKKKIERLKQENERLKKTIQDLHFEPAPVIQSNPTLPVVQPLDLDNDQKMGLESDANGEMEWTNVYVDLESVPPTPSAKLQPSAITNAVATLRSPGSASRRPLYPVIPEDLKHKLRKKAPQFHSEWQLPPPQDLKKRKVNSHVTGATGFPIEVDEKGRAKKAVQCGLKKRLKCQ